MERMRPIRIGIVGAGSCSEEVSKAAYAVGKAVAEREAVLVCGGLGGVMEAAAMGAYEAGGVTIGILPGENEADANPYITLPMPTGLGPARNVLLVRAAHVAIAISGGYGTLSEIALALKMGKRVVGLHTWKNIPGIEHVSSPEEAVDTAFALLSGR